MLIIRLIQLLCLSSAKIMQTSAMKACFQIAECSLSSAKIMQNGDNAKYLVLKLLIIKG